MSDVSRTYQITRIPDAGHDRLRALVQGNPRAVIMERCSQLMRMLAHLQSRDQTVSVFLRVLYSPSAPDPQDRARWFLTLKGRGISGETLDSMVLGGPVAPFFDTDNRDPDERSLRPANDPWDDQTLPDGCVAAVWKREEFLQSLVPVELNPEIPIYYRVIPFQPRADNDYSAVDLALSTLDVPVALELGLEPTDAADIRREHIAWVSRLSAINNPYEKVFQPGLEDELEYSEHFDLSADDEVVPSTANAPSEKVRDPLADEFLRENQDTLAELRKPQLRFTIRVFSPSEETARLVASSWAESCFEEGSYQLATFTRDQALFLRHREASLKGMLDEPLLPAVPQHPDLPPQTLSLRGLASLATDTELAPVFRFPVVAERSMRCIRSGCDPAPVGKKESLLVGFDLETGVTPPADLPPDLEQLFEVGPWSCPEARLKLSSLKKHMFIAGVPGSGKTISVFNLLVQLHRAGKPFLVIEPAKTEYRVLSTLAGTSADRLARDLRVYSPGVESLSPFRYNPFVYPEGVSRDEHIGNLMTCFRAAMPLFGPLEAVLSEAIIEAYRGLPGDRAFPTMSDVVQQARAVFRDKGYAGEVSSNLQAALDVRLGSLTRLSVGSIFQSEQCLPDFEELFKHPTIIEMDRLPNEITCLLTLFLLTSLREYIKTGRTSGADLEHVVVLEEAHNIVGKSGEPKGGEDAVDPKAFASDYICRMLAELRALGEGMIIADQLPSTVSPEVVKNTAVKLAGRLVSQQDREDLGGAMLLSPGQMEDIARLGVGRAFLYHEDYYRPRRVNCLNAHGYLDLENHPFPNDSSLLVHIVDSEWFQQGLVRQLVHIRERAFELSSWILTDAQERAGRFMEWIEGAPTRDNPELALQYTRTEAERVKARLHREYNILMEEEYEPLLPRLKDYGGGDVKELLQPLGEWMTSELNADVAQLDEDLFNVIARCRDASAVLDRQASAEEEKSSGGVVKKMEGTLG